MKATKSQIEKLVKEAVAHALSEAGKAGKTEHSGAKKGKGAYWGKKKDAKKDSNKKRRTADKKSVDESVAPLNEGGAERFEKLDQLREFMSDTDILEELIRYLPDHEWNDHHQTMMQYFSGDPDYGVSAESVDPHNTKAVLEDAMNEMGWSSDAAKFPGVRGLGYDFGKGTFAFDRQMFWARTPEIVKMELLDKIVDPAFVSDEEAMEIAQAFYDEYADEHGGSVETTYGDLKDFVRKFNKAKRQNNESSEPSHMGMATRKF